MKLPANKKAALIAVLLFTLVITQVPAYTKDNIPKRNEIADKYKWNLETIYNTPDECSRDIKKLRTYYIPALKAYKGKLNNPENILKCLTLRDETSRLLGKMYVYTHMKLDENYRDDKTSELCSQSEVISAQVSEAMAFIQPELLTLPAATIKSYIKSEKLSEYRSSLEALIKQKKHTLSKGEEELLSKVSILAEAPNDIYNKLKLSDMTFEKIKDESGNFVPITNTGHSRYLESRNRQVRKRAYESVFGSFDKAKNTFGAILSAEVRKNIFFAQARRYNSTLEAALASEDIPASIFENLIKAAEKNTAYLHKYITLRKKLLNIDKVHLYDMYVPIVNSVNMEIPYDEAKDIIPCALAPLGKDYVNNVESAFNNRWIDVYETRNKRSGAYSWGTYDTHPFILLNYDNTLNSVLTLAHELGHAMNSHYTNKAQSYENSYIPIFTAEVASTTNEFLTLDYLLRNAKSDEEKLYLINALIENIRGSFYNQVMYSEFEKAIHERVEKGEALSASTLCKIWGKLIKKYYGEDFYADRLAELSWARIPHFYMNFYVYKYATSIAASQKLYKGLADGSKDSVQKYMSFLKAGSSASPISTLKKAGVDMTSSEPVDSLLVYFNQLVDEFEALLKKQGRIK